MTAKKTIKEITIMWKEDKRKYVKSSTYSAYALILENHILPTFGDKYELLENEVQEFVLQKLQQRLRAARCAGAARRVRPTRGVRRDRRGHRT